MSGVNRSWTEILARARQRLLSSGDSAAGAEYEPGPGPRDEILASWRRSYDEGARTSGLSTPYDDNINLAGRLVRAAEPVIGRVHEDVLGSPITVILADSRGKVLIRRSGEPALESRLDNALLAPGFNYAERYVGTNGIGTALEGRTTQKVVGFEHFNETLQAFACVGVPVRDPVTRRQLGVLDITTWADRAHPALTALVRQAASVIEEGLMQMAGHGAQALLHEYLVASRKSDDQVLAISDEAFIGSTGAIRGLGNLSREELWPLVQNALTTRDEAQVPLLTEARGPIPLRLRAVRGARGELAGALVIIPVPRHPVEPQVKPLTDPDLTARLPAAPFNSLSPITVGPSVMVRRLALGRLPVCLVGESGVGKVTLVSRIAAEAFPGQLLRSHHADEARGDLPDLIAAWREGAPLLVRGVERMAHDELTELLAEVQRAAATQSDTCGWLAFTLHSAPGKAVATARSDAALTPADRAQSELAARGIPMVVVPPLRGRVQDLHLLVPDMLRQASGGAVTAVTPALMDKLVREPWPGNLAEVWALVEQLAARARHGTADVGDLPPGFGSGVRRKLTPLEWMAREAIIEALRANDGDKQKAAESLGISRASIYRKIKTYGIDTG
ncbi:MAG: sigma-54-dependent Fis family transcriptional regulator [Nocardioides sp.]